MGCAFKLSLLVKPYAFPRAFCKGDSGAVWLRCYLLNFCLVKTKRAFTLNMTKPFNLAIYHKLLLNFLRMITGNC